MFPLRTQAAAADAAELRLDAEGATGDDGNQSCDTESKRAKGAGGLSTRLDCSLGQSKSSAGVRLRKSYPPNERLGDARLPHSPGRNYRLATGRSEETRVVEIRGRVAGVTICYQVDGSGGD